MRVTLLINSLTFFSAEHNRKNTSSRVLLLMLHSFTPPVFYTQIWQAKVTHAKLHTRSYTHAKLHTQSYTHKPAVSVALLFCTQRKNSGMSFTLCECVRKRACVCNCVSKCVCKRVCKRLCKKLHTQTSFLAEQQSDFHPRCQRSLTKEAYLSQPGECACVKVREGDTHKLTHTPSQVLV